MGIRTLLVNRGMGIYYFADSRNKAVQDKVAAVLIARIEEAGARRMNINDEQKFDRLPEVVKGKILAGLLQKGCFNYLICTRANPLEVLRRLEKEPQADTRTLAIVFLQRALREDPGTPGGFTSKLPPQISDEDLHLLFTNGLFDQALFDRVDPRRVVARLDAGIGWRVAALDKALAKDLDLDGIREQARAVATQGFWATPDEHKATQGYERMRKTGVEQPRIIETLNAALDQATSFFSAVELAKTLLQVEEPEEGSAQGQTLKAYSLVKKLIELRAYFISARESGRDANPGEVEKFDQLNEQIAAMDRRDVRPALVKALACPIKTPYRLVDWQIQEIKNELNAWLDNLEQGES